MNFQSNMTFPSNENKLHVYESTMYWLNCDYFCCISHTVSKTWMKGKVKWRRERRKTRNPKPCKVYRTKNTLYVVMWRDASKAHVSHTWCRQRWGKQRTQTQLGLKLLQFNVFDQKIKWVKQKLEQGLDLRNSHDHYKNI